jgi:hypothetical protein
MPPNAHNAAHDSRANDQPVQLLHGEQDEQHHRGLAKALRQRGDGHRDAAQDRPKVGNQVEDRHDRAQKRRIFEPDRPKTETGDGADDRAGCHCHCHGIDANL